MRVGALTSVEGRWESIEVSSPSEREYMQSCCDVFGTKGGMDKTALNRVCGLPGMA